VFLVLLTSRETERYGQMESSACFEDSYYYVSKLKIYKSLCKIFKQIVFDLIMLVFFCTIIVIIWFL
jgi:hypothetical protein